MLQDDNSMSDLPVQPRHTGGWLPEIAALVAACLGRLPALGAWWNRDDWTHLARASGLDLGSAAAGWPALWISDHLYWYLTWPLFGLNADAHSVLRLGLHGLATVLVVRIAWRSGFGPLTRLLAGLVFAASPLAFTPLYWASGVQQLLAAVFALAAVERWLAAPAQGRGQLGWATVLASLAMLCSEESLGLPLLFLGCVWLGVGVGLRDKAYAWAMILLQLLVAGTVGVLVVTQSAAGGEVAATAQVGIVTVLAHLGSYGWWLLSPGPFLALDPGTPLLWAGGTAFLGWAAWGVIRLRQQAPLSLLALGAALLVLAPALPTRENPDPCLAYLAVAPLALLVADIAHRVRTPRWDQLGYLPLLGFMSLVAVAWGFFGMEARLGQRDELGLTADPDARATALSWQGCRTIRTLQSNPSLTGMSGAGLTHLTLLQPVVGPQETSLAASLGERWTQPSDMYRALDGTTGPRLLLGPKVMVNWANGLTTASSQAIVLCETGTGFRMWGQTANAVLYAALTEVGLGHFDRARAHLIRAAKLGDERIMFIYDDGQMVIPLQMVLQQKEAFIDWALGLLTEGVPPMEVAGLQDMFYNLLSSATGRSVEELKAGSTMLRPSAATGQKH